ncbi:MAG: PP2C family protein-serine/threonine phosphatase [Acidobacteria bacterium]|jgi:sigma-B regulation protein RsbU (phosphoserine phosphatase)|nr:PP2C family protein-serine/threonine phosphatase [Acidobacteriota bacterium]
MAESEVRRLQKELQFKKLQLNSIHELTSAMQAQFDVDHVMRIFFSSLMAPLGLSRVFFFDRRHELLRKRGFTLGAGESLLLKKTLDRAVTGAACVSVDELPPALEELKKLLQARRIFTLLNIAENKRKPVVLGLGRKFNLRELAQEDFEFAGILSHFMQVELENIRYLGQILEKKKLEHEMKIARGIQLSLLPQDLPQLKHYDVAVIYEPIQEVGGDYYDILKKRKNIQPLVLADVEGKGLAAALLAASCQAVFHSMNELYLFKPAAFISRANSFIHEITRGNRFITLFWMLLNDEKPALTYVNAGHSAPWLVSAGGARKLDAGGLLLGVSSDSSYEEQTMALASGDVICAFTDGVFEAQDRAGNEFGEQAIADFIRANRRLAAAELGDALYRRIKNFSQKAKFRDDFTIMIVKVR